MTNPTPGTPLPWRTCRGLDGDHMNGIETVTTNGLCGTPIGYCDHDWEDLRISWKMSNDNAAYIVHAANSYPALVALNAELVEALNDTAAFVETLADNDLDEPIADNGMTVGGKLQYDAPALTTRLRALLAKARGEV